MNRRTFLKGAAAGAATVTWAQRGRCAQNDLDRVRTEIVKRHDEALQRLQDWVRQPSIAAENRGVSEGCELTMRLLREAGFDYITRVSTDGQPGVFASLDAGAPRTAGLYFMYDVKQVDPKEWSSPPWDAALVHKPGLGKVLIGRGAVNQKGPQASVLAALHAIRGAGVKMPVNLVLVAEGEEEIGSPNFPQIVRRPEVQAALSRAVGIFMPSHRRTTPLGGWPFRSRPRRRCARAGRVLRHRIDESKDSRDGWGRALVCGVPVRTGNRELKHRQTGCPVWLLGSLVNEKSW